MARNSNRFSNRDSGFSLIEVLVTLALISVLSGLLIASIGQIRTILSITKKNDATMEVEALANYLENSVRNLRVLSLISTAETTRAALTGTQNTLKFVGITRIGSRDFALREIELFMRPSDKAESELIQISASRRIVQHEQPLSSTLATVDSLEFEYLSPSGWQKTWQNQGLPAAIRMTVSITRFGASVAATRNVRFPDR